MIAKFYKDGGKKVGWKGWIETCKGDVVGFIKLDGKIIFNW